jgi:hypothetical protein
MTRINKFAALFVEETPQETKPAPTAPQETKPAPAAPQETKPTTNHQEDNWTFVKSTSSPTKPVIRRVPYGWTPPAKAAPTPVQPPPKDPMADFPALMGGMAVRKPGPVTGAWAKASDAIRQAPAPKPKIVHEEQEEQPVLRGYYAARLRLEEREEERAETYDGGEWYS